MTQVELITAVTERRGVYSRTKFISDINPPVYTEWKDLHVCVTADGICRCNKELPE